MTPDEFAQALTEKFANQKFAARIFHATKGSKYTRIVQEQAGEDTGRPGTTYGGSVHCFIENSTGHVLKAASWKTPAKGVRFTTMEEALAEADVYGGYLYKR